MRQFFGVRFWATLGALLVLVALVVVVAARSNPGQPLSAPAVVERRIDTGGTIERFSPDPGWTLRDGSTVGMADVSLADGRTFLIGEFTPGEIDCEALDRPRGCVLLADLLGEAVVWFAVVAAEDGDAVTLPGVVAVLDGGREARLANGWVVQLMSVVRRDCPTVETTSFRDFVARFGANSVTVFDLDVDEVTTVRCGVGS